MHVKHCASQTQRKSNTAQVRIQYRLPIVNYVRTYRAVQMTFRLQSTQSDRLQHYRPVASVIAQQYSNITFFSLRFLSRKKNSAPFSQVLLFTFFIFKLME